MSEAVSAAAQRSAVEGLAAQGNVDEALALGRSIAEAWYRCQALAAVAKRISEPERQAAILREAFAAADATGERNRVVTVAAWPLKLLAQRDDRTWLEREVHRLLDVITPEPSAARRSDALLYMLGALATAPQDLFLLVFDPFLAASRATAQRNKGESNIVQALPLLAQLIPECAADVAAALRGPTLRARGVSAVAAAREGGAIPCSWPNI
ncbi:MAG TPA: hypothetical protein VIR34_08885 [Gemmatimonadaceae bacterium]